MQHGLLQPWHAFLPREGGHVVALYGSGGKTSLLRACAEVLAAEGVPVIVTATTRSEPLGWPGLDVLTWDQIGPQRSRPYAPLLCLRGAMEPEGKWRGLAPEQVDLLGQLLPERVVLVETDGSAGMPVKLHRPDEPVWPGRTSLALAVLGLGALGRPVGSCLHRWGRLPAPWLPAAAETPWTWELLQRMLHGSHGYLGRLPPEVPAVVALLQMGAVDDSIGLLSFLGDLLRPGGVPLVVLGELAGPNPWLRTAYRLAPQEREEMRR